MRSVIAASSAGDTIDLTQLPQADPGCTSSTITLTQGQINIAHSLTLVGPGSAALAISGGDASRVFYASDSSTVFKLQAITVKNGKVTASSYGGCIDSLGEVDLDAAAVTDCALYAVGAGKYSGVAGAGIYAHRVQMTNGTLVARNINKLSSGSAPTLGGGVAAQIVDCTDSSASGNYAGIGGGIAAIQSATITRCTLDNNIAQDGGGLGGWTSSTLTVSDSTISGNTAKFSGGGIYAAAALTISNSTIAFNSAAGQNAGGVNGFNGMTLTSTIVAQNTNAGGDNLDISLREGQFSGTDNLIMNAGTVAVGNGVVSTANPHLVPLGFHGGLTRTNALMMSSPAIDAGSNPQSLPFDQRGAGFPREVPSGKPDIGAYERQALDDEIFYDGFDTG